MKKWWNVISLIGICCSSLCFLGFPLLLALIPALAMGWLQNDTLMRVMLAMFLVMYVVGAVSAFRVHHRKTPAFIASFGGILLIVASFHALPKLAGWLGLASLFASWFLDFRLARKSHGTSILKPLDQSACHE